MFWDNVAGADFKRQFTAESYRQFLPGGIICTLF